MLPRALPLSLNLSLSRRGRALKPFNYSGGGISAIKQSAAAVKEEGERGNYLIPTIFGRTPRKRGGGGAFVGARSLSFSVSLIYNGDRLL